jgi:uncharacterized zinc-type alcohol dehydrogenase-like protein
MLPTKSYAAQTPSATLAPFSFERREPGAHDVLIKIEYCGVCHSDIHQVRNDWFEGIFPMVPGHEIVGKVEKVGAQVKKFKVGDSVGVGCFVDTCRTCESCTDGLEQYCEKHISFTYNGTQQDQKTPTYGGYSSQIVVDENYVVSVDPKLSLDGVAPLLCAGITTYSPLQHWKVKKGDKVGVLGLGGLGHMAVKFAAAMGAEVTVLSSTAAKKADATKLGAHKFMHTPDESAWATYANYFNLIIDTVSAPHDVDKYLGLVKRDGVLVIVGLPGEPTAINAGSLVANRKNLTGSAMGGIRETQEMLDFCAKHNILSEIEVIPIQKINEAYERMIRNDVRYRFVIDMSSL